MSTIQFAAPQFLVGDLEGSLAFYQRLGFETEFVYDGFYACVSRDGARIHLKCAPKLDAERAHRKAGEHIDAFLDVSDPQELYNEFASDDIPTNGPPAERPWGAVDFNVEDPDGYILCFSKPA